MLFAQNKKDYVENEGPIRYLDGSSLLRPLDIPRPQLLILVALVIAAAIIGGVLLHNVIDSVQGSAARAQASMEENLSREVTYDLPSLPSFVTLDDATIRQTLTDAGLTIYETTAEGEEADTSTLELIKLPSDVSVEEAGLLYMQGISSLDAADAALLLNGSWTLTVDRNELIDMRVRYADFSSGSLETAIDAAITAEGFDAASASEIAVDEVGNTYRSGTIDVNGTTYNWRVSAIALSEVYSVGLPESAMYVGIRMTQA